MDNVIPLANAKTLRISIELAKEGIKTNEKVMDYLREQLLLPENANIVTELNEEIILLQRATYGLKRKLREFERRGGIVK